MASWIQDYIKTLDDRAFIAYMCRRLAETGCTTGGGGSSGYSGFSGYSGQDGTGTGGGFADILMLGGM